MLILLIAIGLYFLLISKNRYINIDSEENKVLFDKCTEALKQFENNMDAITVSNEEAEVRWYKFKKRDIENVDFYDDLITALRRAHLAISPSEVKRNTNAGLILNMFHEDKIKGEDFRKFIKEEYERYTTSSTDFTFVSYYNIDDKTLNSILKSIYEYKYVYDSNPKDYTDLLKNEYLKLLVLNNITEYLLVMV